MQSKKTAARFKNQIKDWRLPNSGEGAVQNINDLLFNIGSVLFYTSYKLLFFAVCKFVQTYTDWSRDG